VVSDSQARIAEDAIPDAKLASNEGQRVTPTEIGTALKRALPSPKAPPDHEADRGFDDYMAAITNSVAGLEFVSHGRFAVATMPPEDWQALWRNWLAFLERASDKGGFLVC
jgi:hypothetical protein